MTAQHTEQSERENGVTKVEPGFRWDGDKLHHVPMLTLEFEPVPANSPNDAKGWADRDALAAALLAATPAAGGGEAVASIYITPSGEREFDDWRCVLPVGRNVLYNHPQPSALPDEVVKDAERLDWLDDAFSQDGGKRIVCLKGCLRAAIDAAMLKEGK